MCTVSHTYCAHAQAMNIPYFLPIVVGTIDINSGTPLTAKKLRAAPCIRYLSIIYQLGGSYCLLPSMMKNVAREI